MKIGFDAKRAFLNTSGLGNYSRSLISGIGTYYPDERLFAFTPSSGSCYPNIQPSVNIVSPSGLAPFWRSFKIKNSIRQYKLDIFHGLSNELPFGIDKLPVLSIVSIHDLIFKRFPEQYPFVDRNIYDLKVRTACKQANMILAISKQTKEDLMEFYKVPETKISVVYQSCDPAFYHSCKDEVKASVMEKFYLPEKYILSVSSLSSRKNIETLIRSIPLVDEDLKLIIVGRGPLKSKLNNLVASLGIEERVRILSDVDNDSLPAIYQQASVFVYPSLFEGFGIPILEAMVSKIPVIVGQNSCFPEVAGKNSIYVDQLSPDSIASGINSVLQDHVLRDHIAEASFTFAERFNLQKVISDLHDVYESI